MSKPNLPKSGKSKSNKPEQLSAVDTIEGKRKRKIGLAGQIMIALLLGIACGVVFHYLVPSGTVRDDIIVNGIFQFVGQGFIRLMQMLVVPLVFCSIACGAASVGDVKTLGRIGGKTLGTYIATTALAVTIALTVGNLINPGLGVDASQLTSNASASNVQTSDVSIMDTLLGIIPTNPFNALAEGNMLAVIFFSLFLGILMAIMGRKVEHVRRFFEEFNGLMMKMTEAVMLVSPIGVFCLLARTFTNLGVEMFLPLIKYMLGVVIALGIQCFIVYVLIFLIFGHMNPIKFFKKFANVMLFAFSTDSSNATIPLNIDTLACTARWHRSPFPWVPPSTWTARLSCRAWPWCSRPSCSA